MKKSSNSGHEAYERQAAMCKAFADPTRLQLIDLLGRKQRWASELQQGWASQDLSQHCYLRGLSAWFRPSARVSSFTAASRCPK